MGQAAIMQIRNAIQDDADAIAQAEYDTAAGQEGLLATYPREIPVQAYQDQINALTDRGLYIVLEDEGVLKGHLQLAPMDLASTCHVVSLTLVVHPGNTGRGYGRRLMAYAIAWATKTQAVEKIELHVRSSNPRAHKFYESLGFSVEGVHRDRVRISSGFVDDISMALFVRDVV